MKRALSRIMSIVLTTVMISSSAVMPAYAAPTDDTEITTEAASTADESVVESSEPSQIDETEGPTEEISDPAEGLTEDNESTDAETAEESEEIEETESVEETTAIEEIKEKAEEAETRNDYLASFDGMGWMSSGSHMVLGTMVVRTSDDLKASQQETLTNAIVSAMISLE